MIIVHFSIHHPQSLHNPFLLLFPFWVLMSPLLDFVVLSIKLLYLGIKSFCLIRFCRCTLHVRSNAQVKIFSFSLLFMHWFASLSIYCAFGAFWGNAFMFWHMFWSIFYFHQWLIHSLKLVLVKYSDFFLINKRKFIKSVKAQPGTQEVYKRIA